MILLAKGSNLYNSAYKPVSPSDTIFVSVGIPKLTTGLSEAITSMITCSKPSGRETKANHCNPGIATSPRQILEAYHVYIMEYSC